MNTHSIIAAIAALILGGAVGSQIGSSDTPVSLPDTARPSDTIIAEDYLSLRPELAVASRETLSDEEQEGLIYMREEEKLARDVYTTLGDVWGLQIFSNIAQSEQTHTEAVRDLLVKYDIPDPVTDDRVGSFTNPAFTELYNTLVHKGQTSLVDALAVGATIEELDIKDLQDRVAETDNTDIRLVYEHLTRGSRNHLRAFTTQLETRGSSYDAQYLSQSEVDSITSSASERGNGQGGGRRGWGGR